MEDIIKIEHLYKSYGEVKAVQDLSFRVKKGELFAFLGLNGAGKSTTISIMCGQLKKDGGRVEINGKNLDEHPTDIKRELGVVFQNSVLDKPISVYENLDEFFSRNGDENLYLATTKAPQSYAEADFSGDVKLMFGKETAGLPLSLREKYKDRCIRIPMLSDVRSLNLANSVAILCYDALRQQGFPGLCGEGEMA